MNKTILVLSLMYFSFNQPCWSEEKVQIFPKDREWKKGEVAYSVYGCGKPSLFDLERTEVPKWMKKMSTRFREAGNIKEVPENSELVFKFTLDSDGNAQNIEVLKSSGNKDLESKAADFIKNAGPFPVASEEVWNKDGFTITFGNPPTLAFKKYIQLKMDLVK